MKNSTQLIFRYAIITLAVIAGTSHYVHAANKKSSKDSFIENQPFSIGDKESWGTSWSLGPTLGLYCIGQGTINDVSGIGNTLANSRIGVVVPGVVLTLSRPFWDRSWMNRCYQVRGGLEVSVAAANQAVILDFIDNATPSANGLPAFFVEQDVRDFRIAPYAELAYYQSRFTYSLTAGFALAFKTLTNFRVHESDNGAYIGQRLVGVPLNFLGTIGVNIYHQMSNGYTLSLQYNFAMGNALYKKQVFIDQPDPYAAQRFQQQALLTDADSIFLPNKPVMGLTVHRFSFSVGNNF